MDLLQKKYIEEIFKEYDEGNTLSQIAKNHNKKINIIKIELLELGGEKGKKILLEELEKKAGLSVNEVIPEYKKYNSAIKVAEVFDVSESKIFNFMREYKTIVGEKEFRNSIIENARVDGDIDQIIEDYRIGITETKIAREKGISQSTVRNIIIKHAKREGYEIYHEHEIARGKIEQSKRIKAYEEENNEIERIEELKKCNKYIMVQAIEGRSAEERKGQNDNKEDEELKDVKIANVDSIYKILKRRKYDYEELSIIANKKGFFLSRINFNKALEMLEESKENKEDKKGEEVEW